jgi:glutathione S-transferase
MSMKLYFAPGACSFVPHCLLEASGAVFEPVMVKLHKGEQYGPEYLAINPRGQVPVLVIDVNGKSVVITQIVAICAYLNEQFPALGFFPKESISRAKAMENLAWMNNSVHTTFTHVFMPNKFTKDEAAQASIKAHAQEQYASLLKELQAMVVALGKQPWLSGENFGALDAYAITLLRWGGIAGIDPLTLPELWAHVQKVAQHPPVANVIERERIQLDVFKRG